MEKRTYKDFNERWDWVLSFMVLEDLFVHEILMMMHKEATKAVRTMSVRVQGSTIILRYNVDFVNSLLDPELRYIITHEIYHVVLHHCTSRRPEDPKEAKLHGKANDLAINTLIQDTSQRHMPKGKNEGLRPSQFGFEEKLSKEQYLQLLREQDNDDDDGGDGEGNGEYGDGDGKSFDSHKEWSESAVADQIIREKVEQVMKNERVWGSVPGDLKAVIIAAQKSQVKWTKHLRRYLGNMITSNTQPTITRPNKRYGLPFTGKKRTYSDRKLVAIDSSGSIGDDELRQFLAEINKLSEIQPMDLVVFDHKIQEGPKQYDRRRKSYNFTGRGGTSFQETFDIAKQQRYSSVIMLTDGCASAPTKPPCVKDVLWVLTGAGDPPVPWGKRVRITPKVAVEA